MKEKIKDKNKQLIFINSENDKRIMEINEKIENLKNLLGKISNPVLVEKTEQEWTELMQEKEYLKKVNEDRKIAENDVDIIFDRVKTLLTNPIAIWNLGSLELKRLQVIVFFGEKLFYKKMEAFKPPLLLRYIRHWITSMHQKS